jgi:hypothetical protein
VTRCEIRMCSLTRSRINLVTLTPASSSSLHRSEYSRAKRTRESTHAAAGAGARERARDMLSVAGSVELEVEAAAPMAES